MKRKPYRKYSDEVRNEVIRSGNPKRFPELSIPRSTAHQWLKSGHTKSVSAVASRSQSSGHGDVKKYLEMILRCLPDEISVAALSQDERHRLLSELRTNLKMWSGILPIRLRAKLGIHLKKCEESADGLCTRRFPGRLTKIEVEGMRVYVESPIYAHMSVASLVHLARRNGDLNCNSKTWYKYIHRMGWQRPPKPAVKPKRRLGIRATRIHQYWHVDVSIIDLQDGSRNFLQVLIDNYSRFVLAWQLKTRIRAADTAGLIASSKCKYLSQFEPVYPCSLISDGGSENNNAVVQSVLAAEPIIIMRIAKREIWGTNAMAESFFKALKHQWLCYQIIQNNEDLRASIGTYVEVHNNEVPYNHLGGRTPQEVLNGVSQKHSPDVAQSSRIDRIVSVRSCRFCHVPEA